MPYSRLADLPKPVRDALPVEAQRVWMAASNAALKQYDGDESKAAAVAWAAVKKKWRKVGDQWMAIKKVAIEIEAEVRKVDAPNRLVWGWGSVIKVDGQPVVDSQGDVITGPTLRKAVHEYVKSLRHAKVMHQGEVVGEVVDTFVWLDDVQKAYQVDFGCEGWSVGMEMPADVVARVESGELNAFSIAGSAIRVEGPDAA